MFWSQVVTGKGKVQGEIRVDSDSSETGDLKYAEFYPVDVVVVKGNAELRLYLTKEEAESLAAGLGRELQVLDRIEIDRKFG